MSNSRCITIVPYDASKEDNFLKAGNEQKEICKKIMNNNSGIVVASNYGRPGGACIQFSDQNNVYFERHPQAKTQEESLLSFITQGNLGLENKFMQQFRPLFKEYSMDRIPNDLPSEFWFLVYPFGKKKGAVDIRTRDNVLKRSLYKREFGIDFYGKYYSFVCAPNASQRNLTNDQIVSTIPKDEKSLKLHTMQRTAVNTDYFTYDDYKGGVENAIAAALSAIDAHQKKYVYIPPLGCGVYAGIFVDKIKRDIRDIYV